MSTLPDCFDPGLPKPSSAEASIRRSLDGVILPEDVGYYCISSIEVGARTLQRLLREMEALRLAQPTGLFYATLPFSTKLLEETIGTALYAGSAYWVGEMTPNVAPPMGGDPPHDLWKPLGLPEDTRNYWRSWMPLTEPGVTITDIEDPDEKWVVNAESVQKGLNAMVKTKHGLRALNNIRSCDHDSEDADCFLQFAAFGEIVFA